MINLDWGNVPSWISAIVSVAAFVAASLAARAAWRQVKYTSNEQRHRELLQEQEHASKVAAWAVPNHPQHSQVEFQYINSGELPIYNLMITPIAEPQLRAALRVVAPAKEIKRITPGHINEKLLNSIPSTKVPVLKSVKFLIDGADRAELLAQSGVVIQFRDALGQAWVRDQNGNLEKANDASDPAWDASFSKDALDENFFIPNLPKEAEIEFFLDGIQEARAVIVNDTTPTQE